MGITRKQHLLQQAIDANTAQLQGPPPPVEAQSLPTDLNGMRVLMRTMLGQQVVPTGTNWEMSANRLATRQTLLENLVMAKFADLLPRLALAEVAQLNTQAQVAVNTSATQLLTAKTALIESATQANTLDVAALKLQEAADQLAIAALQARATGDEAALALVQQKADAAQFDATMARGAALAAQQKADADATAALAAKAAADAAQLTANTAQASFTTLAARFRTKRVATLPAGLNATMSIPVTWDTPFADANYNALAELEGLSLLGLTAIVTNRTATGCTVSIKNVLGIVLAAGAGTVTVTAIHDQI